MSETTSKASPGTSQPGSRAGRAAKANVPADATHRHPALGRAPRNLDAGFPDAADQLRAERSAIAARALTAVADADFRSRLGETKLRLLLADSEVMIERLALAVGADAPALMAEYAEWVAPVLRRRRQSLWDMAAVCEAAKKIVSERLSQDAAASAVRALDAAVASLRKNGRLGGDGHRRNALLKWLYRGV